MQKIGFFLDHHPSPYKGGTGAVTAPKAAIPYLLSHVVPMDKIGCAVISAHSSLPVLFNWAV